MSEEKDIRDILCKYIMDASNQDELEKALRLLSDPYHNLAIRPVLFRMWEKEEKSGAVNLPHLKKPERILDKIHHRINLYAEVNREKTVSKKLVVNLLKIAAVLITGILLGVFTQDFFKNETAVFTAFAPKGSISKILLPDSTLLYLNAGSEVKYFEEAASLPVFPKKKKRHVVLNGEAWFDVAKNKKQPFWVHTSFYDIEVTGTQFNVNAYSSDNMAATTLEKGSVKISSSDITDLQNITVLHPGQQLNYSPGKGLSVIPVNPKRYNSWKDNKLIFINMNLRELFVLLERKYGVEIEVSDDMVLNYHYDSTITNETILEVLDLIAETLPIQYKIEGQRIIIHQK